MLQLSEIILNEGKIDVPPVLFQEIKNFVLYRWKEIAFDPDNKYNLGAKRKRLEFLKDMKSKHFFYIFHQILKAVNNPKYNKDYINLNKLDKLEEFNTVLFYNNGFITIVDKSSKIKDHRFRVSSNLKENLLEAINLFYPIDSSYIQSLEEELNQELQFIEKLKVFPNEKYEGNSSLKINLLRTDLYDGWKYKNLLKFNIMEKLAPTLFIRAETKRAQQFSGAFAPAAKTLIIVFPNEYFYDGLNKIFTTIEHELVHFVQDLLFLNRTKLDINDIEAAYADNTYANFGLPSKKTNEKNLLKSPNKRKVKDRYVTRSPYLSDTYHAYNDAEFYSNFVDEYNALLNYMKLNKDQKPKNNFKNYITSSKRLILLKDKMPTRYKKYVTLLYSELKKKGFFDEI